MKPLFFFFLFFSFFLDSCKVLKENKDFAAVSHMNDWSHNYALGSPSWDSFERFPNNPVYVGRKGMEWPVNGFLFSDPVSKNWYLYIGEYKKNYKVDQDPSTEDFNCIIYKSTDRGKSWSKVGNLFPANIEAFNSIKIQAADAMVIYANGKYHMVFDWISNKFNWSNPVLSGLGYASADKPEGPFIISRKPLKINTEYRQRPLLDRYWRMYAPMIIKRKDDWVLAYMMDTSPARSWALAVSTASKPEGPYTDPKLVLNVERKSYYPPLQEYFPNFLHNKYVYFPATSVAVNRNYQLLYRVKIENMINPDKYKIFSSGSLWHSNNVENEYAGIWGQTFSGFVDNNDSIYVMFPSKNKNNYGTINLAKSSWKHLFKTKGFNFSANGGNSFSFIKRPIDVEKIEAKFKLNGKMHIIWDFHSPIDIHNGWGRFAFNNHSEYKEIMIDGTDWKIKVYNDTNRIVNVDSGKIVKWKSLENKVELKKKDGRYELSINDEICWKGILEGNPGVTGILLDPHSYVFVNHFVLGGRKTNGFVVHGFYEALLNAGNQDSDWEFKKNCMFLYESGAVSKKDSAFAKWNFDGKAFELFSPKGPRYGHINIYLDGKLLKTLSLNNPFEIKSSLIFKYGYFKKGSHAVYIESFDGLLPVDCIRIQL